MWGTNREAFALQMLDDADPLWALDIRCRAVVHWMRQEPTSNWHNQ